MLVGTASPWHGRRNRSSHYTRRFPNARRHKFRISCQSGWRRYLSEQNQASPKLRLAAVITKAKLCSSTGPNAIHRNEGAVLINVIMKLGLQVRKSCDRFKPIRSYKILWEKTAPAMAA